MIEAQPVAIHAGDGTQRSIGTLFSRHMPTSAWFWLHVKFSSGVI